MRLSIALVYILFFGQFLGAQSRIVPVGRGWAKNSVNTTIFRHSSIASHEGLQYVAYYDAEGFVVIGKRKLGSDKWEIKRTQYKGRVEDAHNGISIAVDGDGYLHMSWDHHGDTLRYSRNLEPGSLELSSKMSMTGKSEENLTYPEFYRLPNGNLLFLYRDGSSGNGNLMMNHYEVQTKIWTQRQDGFISGEGKRNAYWQMCTDADGVIHISWVWRESGDVATNHDMAYAKSSDGGLSWQKSSSEPYALPITESSAEYAALIPQNHELINTTSMCADSDGRPYIVTYFRPRDTEVPQYHLIYHDGSMWNTQQIGKRQTAFTLSGGGTKKIPISRPHIVADLKGSTTKAYMIFRDIERGNKVSVAICKDLDKKQWQFRDLNQFSVGSWEPSYDTQLWTNEGVLHLFVQHTGQGDGETTEELPPQMVSIQEWNPDQEESNYLFDGKISEEVLRNYLDRSVTMAEFCVKPTLNVDGRESYYKDDVRLIKNIGAKFIGRTIFRWGSESGLNDPDFLPYAEKVINEVHSFDEDVVFQAGIFEAVSMDIENVPIPAWVFIAFGLEVEDRNFAYEAMLFPDGLFRDRWGKNNSVPDITQMESKLWLYYLATKYIDTGFEAIHWGQVALMGANDEDLTHWFEVLGMIRKYARVNARRHFVLNDAHCPDGAYLKDGVHLMDFNSFPLRIQEKEDEYMEGILKVDFPTTASYQKSIFLKSKGGITPSGWPCKSLPYIVEFDNYGISRHPGKQGDGKFCFIWGYDEISWFSLKSEDDQKRWLEYAYKWLRSTDPYGYLQMPVSRVVTNGIEKGIKYKANIKSDACPVGTGLESKIKELWKN